MDTRKWGPPLWRLLHLVAEGPNANKCRAFWETLPFILPCKFCRASLTAYYEALPIPSKQEDFSLWMYKIHNMVSQKLRDQGQTLDPDPPYEAVQARYKTLLEAGCTATEFPAWEGLFSIADNHPSSSPSAPMPEPPSPPPTSLKERNRYNLLTPAERKEALKRFWTCVPAVLPFPLWQASWRRHAGPVTKAIRNRRSAMSWLWAIQCGMNQDLQCSNKTNFHGLCKTIATYRSGCAKSTRAKTCRALRLKPRKTRKTKQR